MAKTKLQIVSIFDGDQDAAKTFAALIAEKICVAISQDMLALTKAPCYNTDTINQNTRLASGLCG